MFPTLTKALNRGMRAYEILNEAVRPSLLYHGTDPDNACRIIDTNAINAFTSHRAFTPHSKRSGEDVRFVDLGFRPRDMKSYSDDGVQWVYGVSLTRDANFARRWKSGQGIVFVLDEAKLRQRHQIVPYDYHGERREAEEFLVGHLKNLDRYLVAVEVPKRTLDELIQEDEAYDPEHSRYREIVHHPLLRVVNDRWHPITGRPQKLAS